MGKERKEKPQVEEVREADYARTEETPEPENREKSLPIDTEIELKGEDWAKSITPKFSFNISDKSRDHTPDYA